MKVKVGLIGCGNMGSGLFKACAQLDNAEAVAVADPIAENAKRLADELNVNAFSSYEEMLDKGGIDAAIVAVPNYLHANVSVAVAHSGKHVFCEKPMALTVDDCDRMIKASESSNVKLMIGQVLRYLPVFNKMKEILDSGLLGNPFSMYVSRLGSGTWGNPQHWRMKAETCGGVLYELNVHELDYMRYVCGDVDSVCSHMGNFLKHDTRDYEDTVHVLLKFKSGGMGSLLAGQCSSIGGYDGKIHCTRGTMHFDNGKGTINYKPFDGEEVTLGRDDMKTEPGVRREIRLFIESIIEDKEPPIPGWDGKKTIEIVQGAYISAKEDREVKLPF
ncbi:hypothetical protein GF312_04395 [Candidatus Poribacteria bacterium]|nr:hypothetical protein [Candidatus Poribacteria bacterium]